MLNMHKTTPIGTNVEIGQHESLNVGFVVNAYNFYF